MAEIIHFENRKRQNAADNCPIIEKVIDGEIVQYINLDTLTPSQYSMFFSDLPEGNK